LLFTSCKKDDVINVAASNDETTGNPVFSSLVAGLVKTNLVGIFAGAGRSNSTY